ncbi:hypothetical protein Poli38472_000473 [Pythium oligandrum]|uniref:Retrotransposon gag domain-containing protein n=1 Tax=Pythium oligandrum TaxID=41045 RepID=A0A8K1CCJ6_PYTOL|nr:hypothetical protein Poli38472_014915 [Pythium oligandrum]TMW60431.1 hypothetical protein Poli38472_000473 [Pythium oligandrum]|eukprot:TMW54926.1 hypothetical protein Poli38472_014915 [Pythium oligandrum]
MAMALRRVLPKKVKPPQNEFRIRAEFLSVKQGNMDLHDYIQKARYLASCLVGAPMDMATQVTTFMTGLRDGPVKTQLFREYPDTLEEAFSCALREDFNARQARGGTRARSTNDSSDPEPMDLSVAQASQREGRTYHRCQKIGHLARDCRAPAPSSARRRTFDSSRSVRDRPKNADDQ